MVIDRQRRRERGLQAIRVARRISLFRDGPGRCPFMSRCRRSTTLKRSALQCAGLVTRTKRTGGLKRSILKMGRSCPCYTTSTRRCELSIWPRLCVVSMWVGIQRTSWGTVCFRERILRCCFWMGQRVNGTPHRLNDVIRQSKVVHFWSRGIIESFFLYYGKRRGVHTLRRHRS